MLALSPMGQAPPPPPAIDSGSRQTFHHVPGHYPPVYHRPVIDPFVRPAIDPFVLPVVAPFVLPVVKPYLPHIPAPPEPIPLPIVPVHPGPAVSEGPHWLFYALVALMAYYVLIEQRF